MKPKVDAMLRSLVKYIGPNGITQPIAAIYTLDQIRRTEGVKKIRF